jgi:hypothetical protein
MDHLSYGPYEYRRHRLNEHETPLVMGLVRRELEYQAKTHDDLILAEELFRILWRFEQNKWGRPVYPEFSWRELDTYLGISKGPFPDLEHPSEERYYNRS